MSAEFYDLETDAMSDGYEDENHRQAAIRNAREKSFQDREGEFIEQLRQDEEGRTDL